VDETWTVGVARNPPEPATLEEMIAATEPLFKDLPKCWHYDLVTSEYLPKSASGITYACAKCFKLFTVPNHLFGGGDAPKHISTDPFIASNLNQRKVNTTMSEGNSQTDGQPTQAASAPDIMAPIGAGAFGVQITTTDVVGGMGNVKTVTLNDPDGQPFFAEHHQLGVMSVGAVTQDVPPGETQAKP
jgi:hypothetical protein